MAKAKTKSKKRSVTCGKCKETGHNARTCPTNVKTAETTTPVVTEEEKREVLRKAAELPPEPLKRDRPAPTADMGSKATAAPYRCVKCNSVAILVIVRVKDHMQSFKQKKEVFEGALRCEDCMNKPNPAELILVWGAKPDQVVSSEVANG
jgi:hypothetical protein